MPGTPDVTAPLSCFFTSVRNISGHELAFGFLGTHGKRLKAGQSFTVRGDVRDRLAGNKRKFDALERAVHGYTDQSGVSVPATLAIASTPAVHLYDPTLDVTKILTLGNGVIGKADPCWGAYHSV